MAEIIPFRGILYNQDKIKSLSDVVTPPYDVISERQQAGFYSRHPNNVIRLDKNRRQKQDTDKDNPFTRAAAYFTQWLKEGVLIRDTQPALYLTTVEFRLQRSTITRFGLITRVKLEPFEKGIILPHEQTFSKVKTERLELMKACHANFSQVFSVFSDKSNAIDLLKTAAAKTPPVFDFSGDDGLHHRLWRITDPEIHRQVADGMKERRLFIADGHHRYETALNYRQWLNQRHPDLDPMHPANFTMMYLCAVEDPGLIILPTHRLVSNIPADLRDGFIKKAQAYFDIKAFDFVPANPGPARDILKTQMKALPGEHKFAVFIKAQPEFFIMSLKAGVMERVFGNDINPNLKTLDVTVLTRLIFIQILGFNEADLDNEKMVHFKSNEMEALAAVACGDYDMAFILNPTTSDQVRKIAGKGLTMPRKSTYYYPKAITGLVMSDLNEPV